MLNNFHKHIATILCFSAIAFVFTGILSTYAQLTGTVVNIASNNKEIWMTNLNDIHNKYLLYEHNTDIFQLSVQKDSQYIAIVARKENAPNKPVQREKNLYLVDTLRDHAVLIQDKFVNFTNIDISHNGDVVFTNSRSLDGTKPGIYLIRRDEIGKQNPNIILLKEIRSTPSVDWSPNGKQIVYGSYNTGVYLIDVNTGNETFISKKGRYPSFSPDGKKLAYSYFNNATGNIQIDIFSLDAMQPIRTIDDFVWHQYPSTKNLWSPDGKYLIYRATVLDLLEQKDIYTIIAVPVNGGLAERVRGVGIYDWFNPTYPVEPVNRLTTLWGKIKQ